MTADAVGAVAPVSDADPFDVQRALRARGLLRTFNLAGVLSAADVHVGERLADLAAASPHGDEGDDTDAGELLRLAVALAVRAPRLGHVCTDLATASATVTAEGDVPVDLTALPWPSPERWLDVLRRSSLVAEGAREAEERPLRLLGTRLYLDRYWREERAIARDLQGRAEAEAEEVDDGLLRAGLDRFFGDGAPADGQRRAAETAIRRRLTVVAGGPGTGKTTTVASILALLVEQAAGAGRQPPRIALAAPTGKAAARLEQSVHEAAGALHRRGAVEEAVRDRLLATGASTLHRLLGWRPDSRSRFRHDRTDRLPHDVIVVDETSMVSLSLMARLVAAVRDGARLLLVGDPEQLASVEAGAVLGDIVGPEARGAAPPPPSPIADSIVVLHEVFRYGPELARLAEAIQRGDEDDALEVLRAGTPRVRFVEAELAATSPSSPSLAPVRDAIVSAAREVQDAAARGDGQAALAALSAVRVLCAHRRGPHGAQTWARRVEEWLTAGIDGYGTGGRWHLGRPVLVTQNDHALGLYNGDTGVVVDRGDGRPAVAFERRGAVVEVAPSRLSAVETVHAMTIHKSQGSQFGEVAVLLPGPDSPILTRELLYTAVTRAQEGVTVVGTEAAVRTAVRRPIARASGLREALWAAGR